MDKNKIVNLKDIQPRLDKFKQFLSERGAELLEPAATDELLRFRTMDSLSIIFFNPKNGIIAFYAQAEEAWLAFRHGTSWRARPNLSRAGNNQTKTLRKRDGDNCFFCCEYVNTVEESEEHLVSRTHGGPNHISNKFLAHARCNVAAGHLSATQKIKIHTEAKLKKLLRNRNANTPK